jgi:acetolactate synthase-1/2/3 large subunit
VRVYEAIVKGLEGIGVQAAFGGAGENAAGLMLALNLRSRARSAIRRQGGA